MSKTPKKTEAPQEPERLTYADLCAALDEHKDIGAAALALGFGPDPKRARDHFQTTFRRLAAPLGEEPRAGQYLRGKGVAVRTAGVRTRITGKATGTTTYLLEDRAAVELARAVKRALALGAADASAAIEDIARGYLAHVRRRA